MTYHIPPARLDLVVFANASLGADDRAHLETCSTCQGYFADSHHERRKFVQLTLTSFSPFRKPRRGVFMVPTVA